MNRNTRIFEIGGEMNEYSLPEWYVLFWKKLCQTQTARKESGSLGMYTYTYSYLAALLEIDVITEDEKDNLELLLSKACL